MEPLRQSASKEGGRGCPWKASTGDKGGLEGTQTPGRGSLRPQDPRRRQPLPLPSSPGHSPLCVCLLCLWLLILCPFQKLLLSFRQFFKIRDFSTLGFFFFNYRIPVGGTIFKSYKAKAWKIRFPLDLRWPATQVCCSAPRDTSGTSSLQLLPEHLCTDTQMHVYMWCSTQSRLLPHLAFSAFK